MERSIVMRVLIYLSVMVVVLVVMENRTDLPSLESFSRFSNRLQGDDRHSEDRHFVTKSAQRMNEADLIRYMRFTNSTACRIQQDFGGSIIKANGKSGYDGQRPVCLDLGVAPKSGACLVYTTANGEMPFIESMEKFGCNIFVLDQFTDKEDHDQSDKVHWMKVSVSDRNSDQDNKKMRTLSSVYQQLSSRPDHGDAVIDYVNLDLEGGEWQVIPQLVASGMIGNIKQLNIEVHYSNQSVEAMRSYVAVIKSLESAGMVRFGSRPNIFWPSKFFGMNDYFMYEIAWFNRRFFFD